MVLITDFGAKAGTLCTESIQNAIDRCAAGGGGIVAVPAGTFVSGTVYLKDNVELRLAPGAVLKASADMDDYNAEDAYAQNWGSSNEKWKGKHLIVALECRNVSITGEGTIDGSGSAFFGDERHFTDGYAWEGGYVTSKDEKTLRPGQLVCFIECQNVTVRGIAVENAPCWGVYVYGCTFVKINGVRIVNPFECVNTDGVDIDCSQYVTVSDCTILTGDDAIAVRCSEKRLKQPRPCEYITITNCVLASNSTVFRIGVGTGRIRHVNVSDIVVPRAGHLIAFNTSFDGKGNADIADVSFRHIDAQNVGGTVECVVCKGAVRNIAVSDVSACAKGGVLIKRTDDGVIDGFRLKDVHLTLTEPHLYAAEITGASNVGIDTLSVSGETPEEPLHVACCEGVCVKDCRF